MQTLRIILIIISGISFFRAQGQTVSMTAYKYSNCSGQGLTSCYQVNACTFAKNEDGMSIYMEAQLDPFKMNIYVDPWCAWSVGTISSITVGACPGNCCSGAIEVFGVDQTPTNGFYYGYSDQDCSPFVPSDDTYLQDEDPSDTGIGSIVSESVKRQFTTVLQGDKKVKSLWDKNFIYSICGMLAVGLLVGGIVTRHRSQQAYRIIPDNVCETTSLYHPSPKVEDL